MNKADERLITECLNAAQHSRNMWKRMRVNGYGWTWDYYRGWLLDARAIRLGRKFEGLGSAGVKRRHQRAYM